jgi:N6-L-threonylcarbamoyladenine synthase
MPHTTILGLETSCDETAAAVVVDGRDVRSNLVSSQIKLHEKYGGIVPEIAARAHIEQVAPLVEQALADAGLAYADLDAIAVTAGPGLVGSLLIGVTAARTLALTRDLPLVPVDHIEAHATSAALVADKPPWPAIALVVSGGHTSLYHVHGFDRIELLGQTVDDAAGEAFDKVASMLRLPYPGGPSIQRAAEAGNPKAYAFPRTFLNDEDRLDFSFSGLKTAVRYQLVGPGKCDFSQLRLADQRVADLAASFQEAVVDCLVGKAFLALRKTGMNSLCVGGGVAANARLRQRLEARAEADAIQLHVAPPRLCTDNAVMGAIAVERFRARQFEPLDLDAVPGVVRSA